MSTAGAPGASTGGSSAASNEPMPTLTDIFPNQRPDLTAVNVTLSDLPTEADLLAMFRRCCEMKLTIRERQARGRPGTGGRYCKHDSARYEFIDRSILPGLRMGKMPSAFDIRIVFATETQSM